MAHDPTDDFVAIAYVIIVITAAAALVGADKGEGGLRWLRGRRGNWDMYSRHGVQCEVNDLSAQDLVRIRLDSVAIVRDKAIQKQKEKAEKLRQERLQKMEEERQARILARTEKRV